MNTYYYNQSRRQKFTQCWAGQYKSYPVGVTCVSWNTHREYSNISQPMFDFSKSWKIHQFTSHNTI